MDSIDKNDDLELLAALMDGKLSRTERARAIKLLADSDEALEVFASAARDEQLAQVPGPTVTPIWRRWTVSVPIAAAAAITLAVMPRLVGVGGRGASASELATDLRQHPAESVEPGSIVMVDPVTGRIVWDPRWEQRGWPENRGVAQSLTIPRHADTAAESKHAFRLGVRTVDLQVALRSGDTAVAGLVADDILLTLNGVASSGLLVTAYSALRSNLSRLPIATSIERASSLEHELPDVLHSPSFASAQWMAAADLAARTHYAPFFESKHGTRLIPSLSARNLSHDEAQALQDIDSLVSRGTDENTLNRMHIVLSKVIQQRGSISAGAPSDARQVAGPQAVAGAADARVVPVRQSDTARSTKRPQ